jgi:2-methylcitrate dehydratase PrpD
LESIATEASMDPQVLKVASLIRVIKDESLKPHYPEGRPALVRVHLKSGREYENFVPLPQEEFTENELEGKFFEMVEPLLGINRAKRLKKKIDNLEDLSDVGQLFTR